MATTKPDPETVRQLLPVFANVSQTKVSAMWETVLGEMLTLFYPPMRADTDEQMLEQVGLALRAYVVDLEEFDTEALRDGWREVRRTHKVARWPAIQEIRDRCAIARDRRRSNATGDMTLEALYRTGVDSRWIGRAHHFALSRWWSHELFGPAPGEPHCQCPHVVLMYFKLPPTPDSPEISPPDAEAARLG